MDAAAFLLRLALLLLAARVAAELAERIKVPPVLAEIAVGVVLGPSVFGLVHQDEVIAALGEIGAILLLLEVGMHMDLGELTRVGRASLQVALIGVALPLAGGFVLLRGLGMDTGVALFVAAGITATSVGITARVFADLRALLLPEARIVLGAAVADDVAGLVLLTIVTRIVTTGSVEAMALAATIGAAVGFLVVAMAVALWVGRPLSALLKRSKGDGALVVAGLVIALSFAGAASAVKLAPIVGAFVAGIALGRSPDREDIQRRIAPVGQLLIPVFFVGIGLSTDVGAFADLGALGIAAALSVIAVAGKLATAYGVPRGGTDRVLVGIGMVPRGEVGLIFASLGLSSGVLDGRAHAVLLIVVVVTTLMSPPWLRRRLARKRIAHKTSGPVMRPAGGWLETNDDAVDLVTEPDVVAAGDVILTAAAMCERRRPGPRLLAWLATLPEDPPVWDEQLRTRLMALLHEGTVRSWRFLEVTGALRWLLPELDDAVRRRALDPLDLDPAAPWRWSSVDRLHEFASGAPGLRTSEAWRRSSSPDLVLLAALAQDAFAGATDAVTSTRHLAEMIGLQAFERDALVALVRDRHLLRAAAARFDPGAEEHVLDLAAHIGSPAQADALYLLAMADEGLDHIEREAIDELHGLIRSSLDEPGLTGPQASDVVERRRLAAARALEDTHEAARHLEEAPRRYLLSFEPDAIARHLRILEPPLEPTEVRLQAQRVGDEMWSLDVVMRDRVGALAAVARALSAFAIGVERSVVSSWPNGLAIASFEVVGYPRIDWELVRDEMERQIVLGLPSQPVVIPGDIEIVNDASPWYTLVEVRAPDRDGLLGVVATALAQAGADIHRATVSTNRGVAIDQFAVTDRLGRKLDGSAQRSLRAAFAGQPVRQRRVSLRTAERTLR